MNNPWSSVVAGAMAAIDAAENPPPIPRMTPQEALDYLAESIATFFARTEEALEVLQELVDGQGDGR